MFDPDGTCRSLVLNEREVVDMRFYCLDCKEYFDEPKVDRSKYHSNSIGYDGIYEEEICRCPNCNSEDFEEARELCDSCNEFFYETKDVNGVYLCPDCYEKVKDILSDATDKIVGELDMDALKVHALISGFYDDF